MDLVKLDNSIPIKAIPEQELNTIILTQFTIWVANLLSLTDEISANRLETSLPAIKEHCWSMGFSEIKKMFEMYADNKLSIEPIPNYFDRILLGKIVSAYKQQKQVHKKEINHDEIMKEINIKDLVKFFGSYFGAGIINDCYVAFAYEWLEKNKFIELSKEQKHKLVKDAEVLILVNQKENGNLKSKLKEFTLNDIKQDEKIFIAKKIVLQSFLKSITKEQVLSIENLLKNNNQ